MPATLSCSPPAVAAGVAKPRPLDRKIRRPRHDLDPALVKRVDELRRDVVKIREEPCGAEPFGVLRQIDDVAGNGQADRKGDVPLRQLGDRAVVERRHYDGRPGGDLGAEDVLPLAPLHLEDHGSAAGELRQLAHRVDADVVRADVGGAQRLDIAVMKLVVVEEDGRPVGEQTQVGFEAVGTAAERLFEGLDGVLLKAARSAAMAIDPERLSHS